MPGDARGTGSALADVPSLEETVFTVGCLIDGLFRVVYRQRRRRSVFYDMFDDSFFVGVDCFW